MTALSMLSRRVPSPNSGSRLVAALDVGSHKVTCLVGAVVEPPSEETRPAVPRLRVLGVGHQRSHGIAGGAVVDLRAAQGAVAAAVQQAERAAGTRIERVHVGIDCGGLASRRFDGHVDLPRGIVEAADVARLDAGAHAYATRCGERLIALNRLGFRLDGVPAVHEPMGLAGLRLDASFHAILAAPGPVTNLCLLIEACQLEVSTVVPSAYASALAATTEAERHAGVTCVDIGAETTSIAGFLDRHLVLCATLPLGGQQITDDIARATAMPIAEAERIKTLYATVIPGAYDEHELLRAGHCVDGLAGADWLTRAEIGRVAARGVHRVLAGVHGCLEDCGIERVRRSPVVLTGGCSELIGLEDLAGSALGRPVRTASSPRLDGAAGRQSGAAHSAAFSCVMGLALAVAAPSPWVSAAAPAMGARSGYLGRVEQWLRESF